MKCKVIHQIWFEDKLRKVGEVIETTDEKYQKYLEGRGVVEPLAEKAPSAKGKKGKEGTPEGSSEETPENS